MNKKELRIGFLGTGQIAHTHAHCIKEILSDTPYSLHFFDPSPNCSQSFIAQFPKAMSHGDASHLVDSVDVVYICAPNVFHSDYATLSLKKGRAVYCEKPMVQTIKEGHNVIAAEKKYNAKFQVGSQGSFARSVRSKQA